MDYKHNEIEAKWQAYWEENKTFSAREDAGRPKYYVLDMFPYPSGDGLHVGHPLGYIASDIMARYKRLKGFEVLHPMGFDAFGLPAEQYAIETGQHPAVTTEANIDRYSQQLRSMGLAYDWDRAVRTSDPNYYKWTQWMFLQLYKSWYNPDTDKAESIERLVERFEASGSQGVDTLQPFTASGWRGMSTAAQHEVLLGHRLAYLSEAVVNWCPALGTVLANDETKDGLSERGGHPVEKRKMNQWSLRITAYSERLLKGLERIDWSDAIKEVQRNWIGKSVGASVVFKLREKDLGVQVFTTRPDTIYGVSFLAVAPEHPLLDQLVAPDCKAEVAAYVKATESRSERDRMSDVKNITGAFTGTYVIHPLTGEDVPLWVADYVLAGYGTGAVMAVPAGDQRDWNFARHFSLPIHPIFKGHEVEEGALESYDAQLINSAELTGLGVSKAKARAIELLEEKKQGERQVNYRLRDAAFGRQRYWGEPIPIYYKEGIPHPIPEDQLPLLLPEVDRFLPTADGQPPLARAASWKYQGEYDYELTTMPGWAGSSWYYLRYQDPHNDEQPFSPEKVDYWKEVDLYIGGAEHATGHLLYVRFWTKVLYDLGYLPFDEPALKLINQGMIQGVSAFAYRKNGTNTFVSKGLASQYDCTPIRVKIDLLEGESELNLDLFKQWRAEYADAEFELEDGKYHCGREVEKMSKSKYNVQSPDQLCERYGADTLRLYEMFLGPLEQHKPWDTQGIEGSHRFIKKLWKLFHQEEMFKVSEEEAGADERRILHQCIKKVEDDLGRHAFNTVVSEWMICVNKLTELSCNKREILEPLAIMVSPYIPHVAEELWQKLGHTTSVSNAVFPAHNPSYLEQETHAYPVSFNGKTRFTVELKKTLTKEQVTEEVLSHDLAQKWLEGKEPRKVIVVPNRIVNVVV